MDTQETQVYMRLDHTKEMRRCKKHRYERNYANQNPDKFASTYLDSVQRAADPVVANRQHTEPRALFGPRVTIQTSRGIQIQSQGRSESCFRDCVDAQSCVHPISPKTMCDAIPRSARHKTIIAPNLDMKT
jgi:hypothetical protein